MSERPDDPRDLETPAPGTSRRRFLTGAALAAGGVVALTGPARAQTDPSPSPSPSSTDAPPPSPVARYATDVGDGSSRSIDVDHNLGSRDVLVQVFQNANGQEVECDVARVSPTRVTLSFAMAPPPASLRVVVVG